jgi:hypothetical protein
MDNLKSIIFYVDKNNEISETKKDVIYLKEPYFLSKMDLINFIQKNKRDSKNKFYTLENIGVYHIDVQEENLNEFVKNEKNNFLKEHSFLNDIILKETLPIFFDFSQLIIILKIKNNIKNNNSKKIYFTNNNIKLKKKKSLKKNYNI